MGKYFARGTLILLSLFLMASAEAQTIDSVKSQSDSTIQHSNLFKKAIIPTSLLIYGIGSLHDGSLRQFDRYVNGTALGRHSYSGIVDDYLRYAPVATVYALDLLGVKSKNNFIDKTAILLISISLTSTAVTLTKNGVHRERPDISSFTSFPSAHTAMAFMSAEFMHQEYKENSPWFSVAGYAMAITTGTLRLYHHVHWFSDIVMGAGYGMLSTKLAYFVYPYLRRIFIPKKDSNMVVIPSFQKGYMGLALNYAFH